jgi:hypothetical protein
MTSKRHPLRSLFVRLGLVRSDDEIAERFAEADKVSDEARRAVDDSRRIRGLSIEVQSVRKEARR